MAKDMDNEQGGDDGLLKLFSQAGNIGTGDARLFIVSIISSSILVNPRMLIAAFEGA